VRRRQSVSPAFLPPRTELNVVTSFSFSELGHHSTPSTIIRVGSRHREYTKTRCTTLIHSRPPFWSVTVSCMSKYLKFALFLMIYYPLTQHDVLHKLQGLIFAACIPICTTFCSLSSHSSWVSKRQAAVTSVKCVPDCRGSNGTTIIRHTGHKTTHYMIRRPFDLYFK
jgi:hypothetical protein